MAGLGILITSRMPTIPLALASIVAGACLVSCTAQPTSETIASPPVRPNQPAASPTTPPVAKVVAAPDTFHVSTGRAFTFEPITQAQHEAVPGSRFREFPVDSAAAAAVEATYLAATAGRVSRAEESLLFKPSHYSPIHLADGPDDDTYEGYRYLDDLAAIGQWLVEVAQYEGRHYLLIDQATGARTDLIDYPVLSPDHTRFVCAGTSPTGYSANGLQLWQKPAGQPPRLLWQRLMAFNETEWGAADARWRDNQTLVLYKDYTDSGEYVRLRLR